MVEPEEHTTQSTSEEADRLLAELEKASSSSASQHSDNSHNRKSESISGMPKTQPRADNTTPVSPKPGPVRIESTATSQLSVQPIQVQRRRQIVALLVMGLLLIAGALIVNRPPATSQKRTSPTAPQADETPSLPAPLPAPVTQKKAQSERTVTVPKSSNAAWGSSSDYKFNRLPDSEYPNSCAFSQTDSAGETILSKSRMDYWACRDNGGNSSDGYSIAWADGKQTNYTFGPNGEGLIIATNGEKFPIRWMNATRNGDNVIIINHQDGATSWIPGNVNP